MKDKRFIELLNLYVDRQISPPETAELELEIQESPRHQQVYRQYCQMHRATKLVYESFRDHADNQGPRQPANGVATITPIEGRHRRVLWAYYAGGLAAAACLALVVARVNFSSSPGAAIVTGPVAKTSTMMVAPQTVAVARPTTETRVGWLSLQNGLPVESDYPALLAALRQQERVLTGVQNSGGRLQALFDDGVFDSRQVLSQGSQRVFRGRGATNPTPAAEFTAFQFQR